MHQANRSVYLPGISEESQYHQTPDIQSSFRVDVPTLSKLEQSQLVSQIMETPQSPLYVQPTKIKPKPLKGYDDREMKVGRYLTLHRITYRPEIENIYSRNVDDFEQTLTISIGRKSDSLHDRIGPEDLERYVIDFYHAFREQMVLREPPAEYRWMLWMVLAKQSGNIDLHEFQFMTQVLNEECDTLINADVERTFPDHPFFATKIGGRFVGKEKLIKLCRAVGVYFKHIGYTQGMSLILAEILLASGGEEFEAFKFYVHLMKARKLQLHGIIEDFFSMNHFLNYMFMQKLKMHLPEIAEKVDDFCYPEHCWLTKWWISIFAGYLDDYLVLRIIDLVLVTSILSIVDIGLALVFVLQTRLLKADLNDFNLIITNIGKQPEILNNHPNKIIAISRKFASSLEEADRFMEEFGSKSDIPSEIQTRFKKHRENFRTYLRADNSNEGIGHEDILMSVFSVHGKVQQFQPKDPTNRFSTTSFLMQ